MPIVRPLALPVAAGLVAWGSVAALPAATTPPDESAVSIDSVRLLRDLSVLAHDSMQGRAAGTLGSLRARHFLERALAETGAERAGARWGEAFSWPGGTAANLIGIVRGRASVAPVIVLTAHYDHLGVRDGLVFNGADDNASGVSALLEITRQLVAEPTEHSVVVALLDAEEEGSWGARMLLDRPPVERERIALNVNLDMVARTGTGGLWAAGAYHTPALRPILEAVAAGAPVRLRLGHDRPDVPGEEDWTMSSDHSAFHRAGIPFVYFGVEDHEDYHRPSDDVERIDPGAYVAAVRTIMTAIRALDAALPLGAAPTRSTR
jgi:Zn-dependent M28 family amino/carboxypeptidase